MRYAVYFAPMPTSALWRFGSATLGYDAASGREVAFPAVTPLPADHWRAATAEPRRYGFHATLAAPFHTHDHVAERDVVDRVRQVAARHEAFRLGQLEVAVLGRFIALVPTAPPPALAALEADCVHAMAFARAPLSDADRARRLASPLSPRQRANLDTHGYPYVLDDYRFHMTLTGQLDPGSTAAIAAALREAYAPVDAAVDVDDICVFRQPSRESGFQILERIALTPRL